MSTALATMPLSVVNNVEDTLLPSYPFSYLWVSNAIGQSYVDATATIRK